MSQIRNLLKSQTLDDLKPDGLKFSGKNVFPDSAAILSLEDLVSITKSWQAVHAPTYGQPIPQTFNEAQATVTDNDAPSDVLVGTGNVTYKVEAIQITNGGSSTLAGYISLGTTKVATYSAGASEVNTITLPYPLTIGHPQALTVTNTSGTAGDMICQAAYYEIVQ